ncbi:GW dipeptide domain-containing protein [Vagococcus fluvialis]|uniref:GW dipeptide domain-containing protein n=1 Tax=Vagococcus fluvialis TaxID=2738 RepID=UPI0037D357CA
MKSKRLIPVLLSTILFLNVGISSVTVFADNITTSDSSQLEHSTVNSSQPVSEFEDSFSTEENIIVSEDELEVTEHSEEEQANVIFTSPNPEIQQMIDALTESDLQNAVGADGLGEKQHDHDYSVARSYSSSRYENVNNYIKKKNFKTPAIQRDSRFGTTPRYNYKIGKPIGVVVHETANPNSTIQGEINYMYNNYQNAFVHAFTDHNSIIETAPTDYLAWGAGPHANPYFMHIELVEVKTFDEFARSVNNDAYWIATQLKKYGLQPTLADRNNGVGSVISHNAVSNYYGGTNHTDPTGYFASWGYNMDQFFELIEYHYYGNNTGAKPSEPEKYEIFDKDLTIKSNAAFNIHSKPYPYEGFSIIGNTTAHQGTQVHINMKSKTSVATYYNAEGYGWIDSRAFTTNLDTVTKQPFNRSAKFKSNSLYNFYTEPYNTKGSKRTGETTNSLYGTDVELTQTATNNRTKEVFYQVRGKGWVPKAAFDLLYDNENIKVISKDVSIKPGANNNIHSRPYPYKGFKITGTTKPYQGEQVHLSQEAKTSNGTYYLADNIGWINANAFTSSLDTLSKKRGNPAGKIKQGTVYNFYTEPYNTKGAKRTGITTRDFYNQELNLIQTATNNRTKEIFYLIENQGWLPKAAFSVVYDEENITSISKDLTITSSANNNIHTRPYPYYGFQITGTTKTHQGKQVHLSEQAITSNGTYYLADGIGWIRSNAFTSSLDTVTKSTFNRDAKVLNKTFYFYKEPYNTKGSERTGKTTNVLIGKDIVLTQKATSKNNGNIYYHVKNYGWVDQKALLIYDVPNYEKINMRLQVKPNISYNVHTEPYPYKGFKIIGNTKSMNMNKKVFNVYRLAHTSNGVYYEVSGYGWINRDAFQKERTVGTFLGTTRNNVVSELSRHENDRFYLGTPYRSVTWYNDPTATMSPQGAPNGYGAGMNCTGFVAFATKQSGGNIYKITQEANAWGGVSNAYNWRDALKKNTDYSTFTTVDQLLKSGKAKKGDIIYFEPNYNYANYDCHIGFFWGNNSSQSKLWHSAPSENKISNIYAPSPFSLIYLFPMD